MKDRFRTFVKNKEMADLILVGLMLLYIIFAVSNLTAYGEAWDNVTMYQYGEQTAEVYLQPFQKYSEYEYGPVDIRFFGPFLVTTAYLLSKLSLPLLPFWSPLDFFRLIYFLTYLTGVFALFYLCKRYLSAWASLGVTLLFVFQPLFFGQAAVSPKDTTFMAFVTISLYLGLKMIDGLPEDPNQSPLLTKQQVLSLVVLVTFLILFIFFHQRVIDFFITWVSNSSEKNLIRQLFEKMGAEFSAERFSGYVARLSLLARRGVLVASSVAALVVITPRTLAEGIRRTGAAFGGKFVILAGVLLGLSVSIRILGLLVGGILLAILILKKPYRTWNFHIVAYGITSMVAMYLTWPYLWPKPIDRFLTALTVNLGHQHNPTVLFNGISYAASDLPASYVPTLVGVQLTIPLLLLAISGLIIFVLNRKQYSIEFGIIIGLWFFLPILLFVGLRPDLHDNIRHILFILPPLFLLAGLSLEALFQGLKRKHYLFWGLIMVMLLPGLLHISQFHPYEYIYFNQLVGGTAKGAALYEKDYLALSLSEAIEFVNTNAPENSVVYVLGPYNVARNLIRHDISLISRNNNPTDPLDRPDTFLVTFEERFEEGLTPLYQVMAGDVPLGGVYISSVTDE